MSIQIGICDDRAEDIKILTEALYDYDASFKISAYNDGESFIEDWLEGKVLFDIVFLDIYMPGVNGIETARQMRADMKNAKIIFISSSNEHYPEAYDLFAFNYLLKPLNRERLNRVLDQALADIMGERQQQISFSYKGTTYRIFCREILYIESSDKTIYFHMTDKRILQCYGKLDELLKQLPEDSFIRCHQSFVVNILHVREMADNHFRIDQAVISISRKYMKAVKDKYFAYLFAHMSRGL
jgi:DNA-binding LytR/AlgR family response regulator